MENKYIAVKEREERARKQVSKLWIKRFFIAYIACIAIYFIYLFAFQGFSISYVGNVQREYGKFLVESNDEFIGYMVEFEVLTQKVDSVYSESEKEQIRENLERQNNFLKKMQKHAPNDKNQDYMDIYQDMLQIYAFFIQGEIMQAEYCYNYDSNFTLENAFSGSEVSLEQYTMGKELCNMMGNMILNNYKYINEIRNTTYTSKYNIIEMGGTDDETNNSTENNTENTNDNNTSDNPENSENDDVVNDSTSSDPTEESNENNTDGGE
jgi:hypothetical protein